MLQASLLDQYSILRAVGVADLIAPGQLLQQ